MGPGPRTIKTHLPLRYYKEKLENDPALKVAQVMRNPRDTLVSYFRYCSMVELLGPYLGTWDEFFELFKSKQLFWGDLFEHQVEWYNFNKTRENSLILHYEDMRKDLSGTIRKLSDFLGKNLSDKAVDIITQRTTFENMSKDAKLKMDQEWLPFFRKGFMWKGQVGNWKNWLTQDQIDYIDKKCREYFDPIGLTVKYD